MVNTDKQIGSDNEAAKRTIENNSLMDSVSYQRWKINRRKTTIIVGVLLFLVLLALHAALFVLLFYKGNTINIIKCFMFVFYSLSLFGIVIGFEEVIWKEKKKIRILGHEVFLDEIMTLVFSGIMLFRLTYSILYDQIVGYYNAYAKKNIQDKSFFVGNIIVILVSFSIALIVRLRLKTKITRIFWRINWYIVAVEVCITICRVLWFASGLWRLP